MTTPAGWYDDGSGRQRWWDGARWTDVAPPRPTVSPKSRTIASILSFFFGVLGIDRFYLGNVGLGVAKLLLGWLTLGIWPLVDFFVILLGSAHDGNGLPVKDWQ